MAIEEQKRIIAEKNELIAKREKALESSVSRTEDIHRQISLTQAENLERNGSLWRYARR